jgi:hypothetical protein
MDNANQRAMVMSRIAADLALGGAEREANTLFWEVEDIAHYQRRAPDSLAYYHLNYYRAIAGRHEEALWDVDRGLVEVLLDEVLAAIARAFVKAGDLEAARSTAGRIEEREDRLRVLIAAAQAAVVLAAADGAAQQIVAMLDEALALARQLIDSEYRYQYLAQIAVIQAKLGLTGRAVRTAAAILSGQAEYLRPIAMALAEAGDGRRLTQLLLLCAQEPQAALLAVPSVAGLHPDQAPAIAELVANHTWV